MHLINNEANLIIHSPYFKLPQLADIWQQVEIDAIHEPWQERSPDQQDGEPHVREGRSEVDYFASCRHPLLKHEASEHVGHEHGTKHGGNNVAKVLKVCYAAVGRPQRQHLVIEEAEGGVLEIQ